MSLPSGSEVTEYYAVLGRRIRTSREFQRMTQDELAEKAGYSRPALVNIEQGRQAIPVHRLAQIAQALDTKPEHLLPVRHYRTGKWT
jgi:transcriptional regulator with XRE-family HTH domain